MADFIEWQQFENSTLYITENDFFSTVSISRDENYNINFCVMCKELDEKITRNINDVSSFGRVTKGMLSLSSSTR